MKPLPQDTLPQMMEEMEEKHTRKKKKKASDRKEAVFELPFRFRHPSVVCPSRMAVPGCFGNGISFTPKKAGVGPHFLLLLL
jgi:hypothetical protein